MSGTISTNSVGAVGAWLAEQTLLGVFGSTTGVTFGVAFWAHVGGLLAGIGLGFALTRSGFPEPLQANLSHGRLRDS